MSFSWLSSEEPPQEEEEPEDPNEVVSRVSLWLLMALLFFCAVLSLRLKVPKLPQTGLLLLVGVFFRCVGTYVGGVGTSVRHMDGVSSETIMLIFLPALIAECALSLDWYTFKREIWQILILATSAVLLSSFLTAVVVKYILNYHDEFDWYAAMMIGAILSATDHVSVVAILKELKTDEKLQVLMQGETLVNDGSVLALFNWLLSGATKKDTTTGALVKLFFRLWFGGLIIGVAFSVVISIWLSKVVNHVILETLLTIMCAYLMFYTAELEAVHFSGGIAVVVFGLYMSAYGKTFISPFIEKSFHAVWTMLGTVIEALILILGGSLLGTTLMNKQSLHFHDIWMVFALFPLLHVVRAIVIFVHWPLLQLFGYGCTLKQTLILIFGALKGSIAIALGLVVYTNSHFSERQQDIVLFWSCAISAMCIAFDSYILKFLIRRFGFEKMTKAQETMLVSFSEALLESTKKKIKKKRENPDFAQANWEEVATDCASTGMVLKAVGKSLSVTVSMQTKSAEVLLDSYRNSSSLTDHAMRHETRRRFYCMLKKLYWHRFEHGLCSREAAFTLIESANRSLDDVGVEMKDWLIVEPWLLPRRTLKALNYFTHYRCVGRVCLGAFYWYITRAYDAAVNFVKVHKEAEEQMEEMELVDKQEVLESIMEESHKQMEAAERFLKENLMQYPEVYVFVQTHQVKYQLLYAELEEVEEAYELGTITKIEYSELKHFVHQKIEKLEAKSSPRIPTLVDSLQANFLFGHLSVRVLKDLVQGLGEHTLTDKARLLVAAEERKELVVVLKGRVVEKGMRYEIEHCPGDVIGTQFLLAASEFSRENIDGESVNLSLIVQIPMKKIESLLHQDEEFHRKMLILCARSALKMTPKRFGDLGKLPAQYHSAIFADCSLLLLATDQSFSLSLCAVLLAGSLSNGLSALAYIDGRLGESVTASAPCTLLVLAQKYQDCIQKENWDIMAAVKKLDKPMVKMSLRLGANVRSSQLGDPLRTESFEEAEKKTPLLSLNS